MINLNLYDTTPYLKTVVEKTGYKKIDSLMFLYWLVKNINPNCVVELGTGIACSTVFIALGIDRGRVISVDDYREEWSSLASAQENLLNCGVSNKVELIMADTRDTWTEHCQDIIAPEIVFMDASHSNKDLQNEYRILKTILPENHVIVIDDAFAHDTNNFISKLAELPEYKVCHILKLHEGVAVLCTEIDKYLPIIVYAIWKSYEEDYK